MPTSPSPDPNQALADWAHRLEGLLAEQPVLPGMPADRQAVRIRESVLGSIGRLADLARDLDPIKHPGRVFNPSDPSLVGPFIGLGLLAQPRRPLGEVGKFYGSGVYALYYLGDFDAYAPLRGTEHPIYVGKADPKDPRAETPETQGPQLSGRLAEHAKSIRRAGGTLRIEDFECRFLVISSGWQASAETFLIRLYAPVWNSETGICHGLGKHGDSGETRANRRSPWDTLHPGRAWAAGALPDQFPEADIRRNIASHLAAKPPVGTIDEAIQRFFDALR